MRLEIKTNMFNAMRYYDIELTEEQVIEIKRRITSKDIDDDEKISDDIELWFYLTNELEVEMAIDFFDFEEEYPDDNDELINLFK
jgi:hypothetical protein